MTYSTTKIKTRKYFKYWLLLEIYFIQLKANEIIWLELVDDFDLDLYVIDHEDEVFAPSFIWPKNSRRLLEYPAKQRLGKTLSYIQLQLTKQSNKQYSKPCNSTLGYVYGGKLDINNDWIKTLSIFYFIFDWRTFIIC